MTRSDSPQVPVIHLDPQAADHHGEAARMRALGPVVRAILPGYVTVWVITEHALLAELVGDPRISKDWRNWAALARGDIPDDWPLIGMVKVINMVTRDAPDHHRLRRPVISTLTPRRVEQLRPRVTDIVTTLLDAFPGHASHDGSVDVRRHYAYPVPMRVICDLVGVPEPWREHLRDLVENLFRTDLGPDEVVATQRGRHDLLNNLVTLRRAEPRDDLTSALIATTEHDPHALTDEELIDTLWLLLTAGHETTLNLIVNGTRALLAHPDQLAAARADDAWDRVVEEVLRWDSPIGNFPARYPLEDITLAGVTIPRGDAILAPYSGVGRDPAQHGPDRRPLRHQPTRHQTSRVRRGATLLPRRPPRPHGRHPRPARTVHPLHPDTGRRTQPRALPVLQLRPDLPVHLTPTHLANS